MTTTAEILHKSHLNLKELQDIYVNIDQFNLKYL
jgi:hypothetical protein